MTAIKPSDSVLRDQIDADGYNNTLNVVNILLHNLYYLSIKFNILFYHYLSFIFLIILYIFSIN